MIAPTMSALEPESSQLSIDIPASVVDAIPGHGTVLAFDFGTRKTGVACGELSLRTTHPLTTIHAESNAARLSACDALIAQWQPVLLVVGMPSHADGRVHELKPRIEKFARALRKRYAKPVVHVDEYLSSHAATQRAQEHGGREGRRARIDELAAQEILQGFFGALAQDHASRAA